MPFSLMEVFVSEPICCLICLKPVPRAGCSHSMILEKAKREGPSATPSLTGWCAEPDLGLCAS